MVDTPGRRVISWDRRPRSITVPKQRYEEIADDLRSRIASGQYPPGSRLPSRRELGIEFGVSDTVLDKAFLILRGEGRVETLAGVGVYVRDT
jgi:GntR family transcriptional regulator